jgi:hypothetical protein
VEGIIGIALVVLCVALMLGIGRTVNGNMRVKG